MRTFGKFVNPDIEWQVTEWNGERMLNETVQSSPRALLTIDIYPLLQFELAYDMKPEDVIQMEVAEEEMDRFILSEVVPQFIHTFTSIKDYVIPIGIDKHTGSATSFGTVPPISSQKHDLHCFLY